MNCILILDDEKEIADLLRVYFQNEGYAVLTAATVTEAWDKITTKILISPYWM